MSRLTKLLSPRPAAISGPSGLQFDATTPPRGVTAPGHFLPPPAPRSPAAPAEDADRERGRQLTAQWRRAIMSAAEQHIFGAMLILLHRHLADLSARGQVARGGRGARGTGLEGWLHQYAPAVKRPTALRWMKATHGLMAKAGVLTPEGLQRLLRSEAAELSEDDWVKQRDLFTLIENCSQNELLTPVPTKMEKARRLTGHEATNVLRTLCTNVGEHLRCLHSEKAYIALKDAELDGLIDHLEATLEDVRAWRKLPKTDREDALAEQIARQAKATRHPHAQH